MKMMPSGRKRKRSCRREICMGINPIFKEVAEMYKLGQIMLIAGILIMLTISVLLLVGIVDGKIAGGAVVLSLILAGSGSSLSKKNKR